MKIKKLWVALLGMVVAFSACKYDDDQLWDEVYKLQERVQKLEDLCELLNTNIEATQEVVETIEENGVITSISPISRNSYAGYVIEFSSGKTITLYNGIDGKDGKDGADGKDGKSPQLGIKDLGDGNYGWVLNGELLKDNNGNPLIVNGKDGKDGADGKDGIDGIDGSDGKDGTDGKDGKDGKNAPLPQLKTGIELENEGIAGDWNRTSLYISVDNAKTWIEIPSNSNCSTFNKIEVKENVVIFTLYDNSTIAIPRVKDLASLILGKWNLYDDDGCYLFQFKDDGTYTKDKNYNGMYSSADKGTYEIIKERNSIILYPESIPNEDDTEDIFDCIIVNEYLLKVIIHEHSGLQYLYRSDAFVFETTEINAPQEGGTFTIQVDAKFPIKVSDKDDVPAIGVNSNNIYASLGSVLVFTPSISENSIVVEIGPNMSKLNLKAEFYIEDTKGNRIAIISINQEKNTEATPVEVNLSDYGIYKSNEILQQIDLLSIGNIGWEYASGGNLDFKPGLSASNGLLSDYWSMIYQRIRDLNIFLNQAEQEYTNGPLKAPLETLRTILYYNLAIYWGNVPYVIESNLNDYTSIQQLTTTQLFEKLIPQLINAIDVLEEKSVPNIHEEDAIFLSKDVARMALAQIYMYQEKYNDAETLLQKIKDNNYYSFHTSISVYSYTDLLLSLAECKLNGDTPAGVNTYISEISNHYGISIEPTDEIQKIKEIYQKAEIRYGYFAFLKRNGLAKETIGITDDYQLLFPIPQSEINLNPNMGQNPGY